MHREGVVGKRAVSVRLPRVLQLLEEATKFLCLKAVIGSEVAPAIRFLDVVDQAVGVVETDRPGEEILGAAGVFAAHHAGGDPGGIAEECEKDEFVDGLESCPRSASIALFG